MAATAPGQETKVLGHLVFLNRRSFLANTGASVSLVSGPSSPQGHLLTAANSAAITTGPERALTLHLQDSQSAMHQRNFTFILRKFHITVDPVAACVRCSGSTTFPGILSLSLNNRCWLPCQQTSNQSSPHSLMSAPPRSPCRRWRLMCSTSCRQRALPSLPGSGVWTQTSYAPPRRYSQPGSGTELSGGPTASGAVLSTW